MTIPSASKFDQTSLRDTINAFRSSGTRAPTSDFEIPPDLATAEAIQRHAILPGDIADAREGGEVADGHSRRLAPSSLHFERIWASAVMASRYAA